MIKGRQNSDKTKSKRHLRNTANDTISDMRLKRAENNNSKQKFYYSFLTIVLIFCLFQITINTVMNISKIISHKAKLIQLEKTRDMALAKNEQLKDNIKNFSNVNSLEAIARNNLKMASKGEVLVIINTPNNTEKDNNNKKDKWKIKLH